MKNLYTPILTILIALTIINTSHAQLESADRIEKGYIQTDKPIYMPGDEIWIKGWVLNGANKPTILSNYATLEIIKPDGSKLLSRDILLENGMITEYLKLDINAVGGIYQLKIKTEIMRSIDSNYEYCKNIIVQKYDPPRLLMKIDLDKEAYGKGESVTIDFNVKDLKDRPITNITAAYSLFIDGIESQKLYQITDNKGDSKVTFALPTELNTSNISVNAKIEYRNQVESISKRIPIILENIDLQFLPEGGTLLEGYQNVIAFKALTETGKPADVSGDILNEKGQKITEFTSIHDGMGKVNFIPKNGEKYFAKICSPYESSQLISLQEQVGGKTKISLVEHTEQQIIVDIIGKKEKDLTLVLSNLCEDIWSKSVSNKNETTNISIPISNLSQGIHKISLRDDNGIQSERLVFLHPERGINVSVSLDKTIFGLREKVTAQIKTIDYKGRPISTDLGIAVVEDKMLSFADDKQAHLTSELLLSSELQGDIHEPNYYFDSITIETKEHLDLVMLTHGWRTYLSQASEEKALNYFIDQNTYIGRVCKRKGGEGIKTQVMVHEYNQDFVTVVDTDDEGYFVLPQHLNKTFNVYANTSQHSAYIKTVARDDFNIMDSKYYSMIKEKWMENPKMLLKNVFQNKNETQNLQVEEVEIPGKFVMTLEEGALLDAIEIVEYKAPLLELGNTTSGSTITAEAIRSLPVKSINAIAATTAGISVAGDHNISIRGSRTDATVYYVDGIRVSGLIPQAVGFKEDSYFLNKVYGNSYSPSNKHIIAKQYVRYRPKLSNKRRFYVPKYIKQDAKVRTDFRQTIYWNPNVQTNEHGEATIKFFTSDEVTSFSIIAEGVSADGELGRGTEKVVAVKPLNISCKLPAYFVLGDTALLSAVVNNDGERDQHVTLEVSAPDLNLEIDSEDQSVFIKKGESHSFQIKATPTEESLTSNLLISVKGQRESDILVKSIAILNPYFPRQLSYSGIDSDTFNIDLTNPIMSTLQAEFNTYNPVNTALEGIQSLLRKPSGCFEQVSSSTYPNVMVYQYLRRNESANKAPMDKAMKYIKQGYKKLVGYETTEDGFEWYGNTPANIALTAYGLLEFTDMAQIYQGVDKKMLNRTIDFLMAAKDGDGGFVNRKGRVGFGSILYEVQTAYVLYALTRQTIKSVDIAKEYETAKKHAIDSEDLYLTALMANTAHNQNLLDDYQELINLIMHALNKKSLEKITCANTVTRSGPMDKNIETLSLCALALMKGEQENKPKVAKIIDHLIRSRKGGRFGSTQATCLAIQAILTYSDWCPPKVKGEEATITAFLDNKMLSSSKDKLDITDKIDLDTKQLIVNYSGESDKSYEMNINYMSKIPQSSDDPELGLVTRIFQSTCTVADQVSFEILLTNLKDRLSANPTIMIGIPAGMSLQMKQLKELQENGEFDFFEVFDNKLVLYFNEMQSLEKKKIILDLKAEIAGQFTAPPSCAYPYYDDQNTTWISGTRVNINQDAEPLNF